MVNAVVTSTTNAIKVVFNATAGTVGIDKGTWRKDEISQVVLDDDGSRIFVYTKDGTRWQVAYSAQTDCILVDTVDGSSPSSASDLYDKLSALIE